MYHMTAFLVNKGVKKWGESCSSYPSEQENHQVTATGRRWDQSRGQEVTVTPSVFSPAPESLWHFWNVGSWYLLLSSVQFSCSVGSDSLQPHEPQHARPPCPSPTPRVYSNSCPSSQWCHPAISPSVVPFFSCPQSFPASGSFQMSQLFISGGQSIGVSASASVLPMNIQDWFPLGWTG